MEQNYTVCYKLHDSKSGQWSNQAVAQYSDYWEAMAKYGSEVARLINAQDYDFVLVYLMDTFGNINPSNKTWRDSRVAPEPEPNEGE